MGIFRLQNNVPNYYVDKSRDFQLLCRAFDCVNASVKTSIDSMTHIVDTTTCVNSIIQLLQTKLGFFTFSQYSDDDVRSVLLGFIDMVRNKGSKQAIQQAVNLFIRMSKVNSTGDVQVDNTTHSSIISIETEPLDIGILDEIMSYIVPTGYVVVYQFSNATKQENLFGTGNVAYSVNVDIPSNAIIADSAQTGGYALLTKSVGVVELCDEAVSSAQDDDEKCSDTWGNDIDPWPTPTEE